MKEMNNISKQIAVTINNELEKTDQLEATVQGSPSCANTATTCATVTDASRDIPFCCSVPLPGNFLPTLGAPKVLLDPRCLKAIIEPCCCNGVHKWDIRIIGCIPFIINVNIDNTGVCPRPSDSTIATCCSNSVCVDRVICNKCSYKDAVISHSKIVFNCDTVFVSSLSQSFNTGDCFTQVTGTFRLPTCP
ncbi:hypothetical protein ACH36K_16915 [Clostridium sp. MB05]|jgi:hypothetical protein|uniref:hypothetical protein n=1 Tax=Clostridium sp. MB05 TaxID=3376682 RepID=UPI003982BB14